MISDEEIDRVLHWLVDTAPKAAKARAEREYLSEYRKSLKATLMADSDSPSVAAAEVVAYAHPEYRALLEALRTAVEIDEKMRWLHSAAETKIEVWRSQQANQRAQAKVT